MDTLLASSEFDFDDIAPDFDNLFDDLGQLTDLEGEAIDRVIKPFRVRTVLDCACGTGIQSIGLARKGYQVSASDISNRMVEILKNKSISENLSIEAKVSDFRDLKTWQDRVFDATISMGNSLTLMPDRKMVIQALTSMIRTVKKPGGLIVIGLHNYMKPEQDRVLILQRHRRFDSDTSEIVFDLREFSDERVLVTYFFISRVKREWVLKTYSKSYMLLSIDELSKELFSAGCKDVHLFDISGEREYKKDDEWVIAVGIV